MSESPIRALSKAFWGNAPWTIDFHPAPLPLPDTVDIAIVGAGFTGLAAAAWMRHLDPRKTVAVFESASIGAGSSGHTGGMALAQTAAGDLPGLGDVLAGFSTILKTLNVDCDLTLPGVYEISHSGTQPHSPISWNDSGKLGVCEEVPGGTINPGKLVSGLARAAVNHGAMLFENARVNNIGHGDTLALDVCGKKIFADQVLIATNAESLELSSLQRRAQPKFTLAVATDPLETAQLAQLGLSSGKPFYTTDLPYLWGRLLDGNRIIFGSGLVHLNDWRELSTLDITVGEPARLLHDLEQRVRGFHPVLRDVRFNHRWGGPILIADKWQPVFAHHPESSRIITLGAYSGHGVALSIYLGSWAAEVLLHGKPLPTWNSP